MELYEKAFEFLCENPREGLTLCGLIILVLLLFTLGGHDSPKIVRFGVSPSAIIFFLGLAGAIFFRDNLERPSLLIASWCIVVLGVLGIFVCGFIILFVNND